MKNIPKKTVRSAAPEAASVLNQSLRALTGANPRANRAALGRLRSLSNDIDDTIHGVCAPDSATSPADHLNTLNVFEGHVLLVPQYAGKNRRIDCAPVNHHQDFIGVSTAEPANVN